MAAAPGDYDRGEMEIEEQSDTFSGFMRVSVWSSLLIIISVLFFSLVFAAGAPWLPSLIGSIAVGAIGGFFLGMKGAWYGSLFGLTVLGLVVGGVVSLLAG